MQFLSLAMKNFKATREMFLDFTEPGLTLLLGPNGAGKTTVADAICFALLNRSVSGRRPKQLVSTIFDDTLEVVLELKNEHNTHFQICRRVTQKGAASLDIFKDHSQEAMIFDHTNLANAFLRQICSKDLFFNAVFFSKSSGAFFLDMRDTQRKKFLEKLLGMEVFEIAEKNVTAKVVDQNLVLSSIKHEQEAFTKFSKTREEDLQTLFNDLAEAEKLLTSENQSITENIGTLTAWLKEAEKQSVELQKLQECCTLKTAKYAEIAKKITIQDQALQDETKSLHELFASQQETLNKQLNSYKDIATKLQLRVEREKRRIQVACQQQIEAQLSECSVTFAKKAEAEKQQQTTTLTAQQQKTQVQLKALNEILQKTETTFQKDQKVLQDQYFKTQRQSNERLRICRLDLQKDVVRLKELSHTISTVEAQATQHLKEKTELEEARRSGICPTCKRPGVGSNEMLRQLELTSEKLHQLLSQLKMLTTEDTQLAEREAQLNTYIKDLELRLTDDENKFKQEVQKQHESFINSVAEQRQQVDTLQQLLSSLNEQRITVLNAVDLQMKQQLEVDSAKIKRHVKAVFDEKLAALSDKFCELLAQQQAKVTKVQNEIHEFRITSEKRLETDPKRLRLLKSVLDLQEQHKQTYDELTEAQALLRALESVYGPNIVSKQQQNLNEKVQRQKQIHSSFKANEKRRAESQKNFEEWKKNELSRLQEEHAKAQRYLSILKFWQHAFSSKGIRLQFLETVFPELNRQLQRKAELISGGQLSITLERSGEKLLFNAQNLESQNYYDTFSSGEKSLCALIFLLSIAEVLSSFQMFTTNLSIFDEIFDSLDFFNSGVVFDALSELSKEHHVILATHNELYKESDVAARVIEPHLL